MQIKITLPPHQINREESKIAYAVLLSQRRFWRKLGFGINSGNNLAVGYQSSGEANSNYGNIPTHNSSLLLRFSSVLL